jgi:hypothetical protein
VLVNNTGLRTDGAGRGRGPRLPIYDDAQASRPVCERAVTKYHRATHLIILCRRGNVETALHRLRTIMGKLKPTVNEEKTRTCKVPDGEFDFLGSTFGRMYSPTTGKARMALRPR